MDARVKRTGGLIWPEEGVTSAVPYGVFTEQAVYDEEQARIFRGPTWNFIGLAAELPNAGDFKATFVGDTPVVMTRGDDGAIQAWVNRCAHRGALVCRELRGNNAAGTYTCVYHQWSFDARGDLVGVPFRKGLGGKGGYPADFDMKQHGLRKLRLENYHGAVFVTFDDAMPGFQDYIGADGAVDYHLQRILKDRDLEVLGHTRQYIPSNWKFYAENTKDPYHASLLHLFHMTFGLYRSSQVGGVNITNGWHTVLFSRSGTDSDAAITETRDSKLRTYQADSYTLADPSLLNGRKGEWGDDVTLVIMSLMPNLVIQQIQNTLAVRQIVPKGRDAFELVWTYFGYKTDDEELRNIRLKQANLIGPAGLISMEDGESSVICQQAVIRDQNTWSCIEMGGRDVKDADHLVTETTIRAFWDEYRQLMGY
ncbi:aromatic ring-hydroxylating dioxygenase subunit alpha [Immundisolibacter sp.]|uniref:aromatic ring-hydroxylating dioxygenase subunit alpha n=1 Tax=Immundisolibacter sp. TaxID=1934948 RepID=UPI00356A1CBF